jgi:glycosyltransferase involved in cell wall biosynthesis
VVLFAAPGSDPRFADEMVIHPHLPQLSALASIDSHLPEPGFLLDQHAFLFVVAKLMERRDIDVIHNHALHHLPLAAACAIDKPFVTTLHTPPFPWMEVGAALADPRAVFVAVSNALASTWVSLTPAPVVVANGIDTARFPAGPGGPDLAWVGRLVPEKGVDLAIAAARLAGFRLRIVGPRSDPAWFETAVRPLLGADITYEGHVDQRAAAHIVGRSAALLVTPRWDEPFGLVAAEGAATGTPVVAVDKGGLGDTVDPLIGGLVPAFNRDDRLVAALASQIQRTALLPRASVRRQALVRFSAERMATAYETIYQDAIKAWRAPASTQRASTGTPTTLPGG